MLIADTEIASTMNALRKSAGMTVLEFQSWPPAVDGDRRWHLVDGTPICMAPASENHGSIQAQATILIGVHLEKFRPGCRVVVAPGVVPGKRSNTNQRIPDVGVTCAPPVGSPIVTAPVLLIEILFPSNEAMTRASVWAYTTIPDVAEILLLSSTEIRAELLRRDPGPEWQEAPLFLFDGDTVELDSIGFRAPLRDFYRTTSLV